MSVCIRIFDDGREVLSRDLDVNTYVVGSGSNCDISLEDSSVAPKHIEIRVTASSVYFTNLSSEPMLVNGSPLETAEPTSGDSVQIGKYSIVISHGTASRSGQVEVEDIPAGASDSPENGSSPAADLVANATQQVEVPSRSFAGASEGSAALNVQDTRIEMKPLVAKVIFTEGPNAGKEFFLETYEVTFGRSKKADIFIDDEKLSRLHAKVSRVGFGYRLIDLGSRNGTYVNGMRILEHPLGSFDEISLGRSRIKFVIHDMASNLGKQAQGVSVENTKSVQVNPEEQAKLLAQHHAGQQAALPEDEDFQLEDKGLLQRIPKKARIGLAVVAALGLVFFLLPSGPSPEGDKKPGGAVTGKSVPSVPKEYSQLSPPLQRKMEGFYQSAIRLAREENYKQAIDNLKQIHERLPYYKRSRDLLADYERGAKSQSVQKAMNKAKKEEGSQLGIYLENGLYYLKQGDFKRAAEAFNSAIVIDPNNAIAAKGLKAAEKKVKDLNKVPADRDPEFDKKAKVKEYFKKSVAAFKQRRYSEAIKWAEEIRKIEIRGEDKYLNEAKQIIDLAKQQRKDEFDSFLVEARERYEEQDYMASRDLTEEMVKRDPLYKPAKELLSKSKNKLNELAKEAYTHGIVLESMNKLDEAVQYWNRGRQFVRPGDPYYNKIKKKLDYYE